MQAELEEDPGNTSVLLGLGKIFHEDWKRRPVEDTEKNKALTMAQKYYQECARLVSGDLQVCQDTHDDRPCSREIRCVKFGGRVLVSDSKETRRLSWQRIAVVSSVCKILAIFWCVALYFMTGHFIGKVLC